MSHNHKTTEQKIAEINKILEPLNGEKLHIIPCLFFNQKSKHIFPYRIKFLLPQLFGYADTRQSTVCISYLGAYLQLKRETDSAKKSFTQILQEQNFKPIKQLLNPIENNLLPQAETVVCPAERKTTKGTIEYLNRRHPVNSDLVLNRYTCYYRLLYDTYKQVISGIFRKPNDYLCFHEAELYDTAKLLADCKAPCGLGDIVQRKKMLETLTREVRSFELDCYEEAQELDPTPPYVETEPTSILGKLAEIFTFDAEEHIADYLDSWED